MCQWCRFCFSHFFPNHFKKDATVCILQRNLFFSVPVPAMVPVNQIRRTDLLRSGTMVFRVMWTVLHKHDQQEGELEQSNCWRKRTTQKLLYILVGLRSFPTSNFEFPNCSSPKCCMCGICVTIYNTSEHTVNIGYVLIGLFGVYQFDFIYVYDSFIMPHIVSISMAQLHTINGFYVCLWDFHGVASPTMIDDQTPRSTQFMCHLYVYIIFLIKPCYR
jgi:uncharacterized membrane protein YuzA (DUF378 family)